MASQGSNNRVQDPESSLAPKDAALFKNMMEFYNFKNYKKALKVAETILVKYPNHGETLSVKALLTLFIDPSKEDDIVELAKRGLRNGINSYLCWHVLGVIYKQLKKYKETVKCFVMALKLDPHNDRLMKEICCLQIELKDYCSFRKFASSQLKLKSKEYREWVMFAFSQHLCGNLVISCEILEEADRLFKPNYKVEPQELSESIMYRAMLYEHTGQFIKCAKLLDEKASLLKDNLSRLELKAKVLFLAKNRLAANITCKELLKINPNNARFVLLYFMTHPNDKIRRLFLYPFNSYKRADKGSIYEKKLENDSRNLLENTLILPETKKYAFVVSNEVLDIDGEYTSAGWSLENRLYHNFDLFVRAKARERNLQYMECYSYPEYALKVSRMLDLRYLPHPDSLETIEEVLSVLNEYIVDCPGIDLVVYSKYRRYLKRDKYPLVMMARSLTGDEEDLLVDALDELNLKDFFIYHCFVFMFTSGYKFYERAKMCIIGSVDRGSTNIFKMFIHCLTFKKAYILLFLLSKFSERLLKRQRIDGLKESKEVKVPEHEVSCNYRLLVVILFLAKVYDFMGSFRKAIEVLNLGYKLSPTSIDVVCMRGKVYRHMGNYKASNEDFCRGTDIDRSDRQTNAKAAKSILRTLDFEASLSKWKSFLTEDICNRNDKEPPPDVPSFKFELMYAQLKYDIYLKTTLDEEQKEEETEEESEYEEYTDSDEGEVVENVEKEYGYNRFRSDGSMYREIKEKKEKKEEGIVIGTGDIVEHKRVQYNQEFEFKDYYSDEDVSDKENDKSVEGEGTSEVDDTVQSELDDGTESKEIDEKEETKELERKLQIIEKDEVSEKKQLEPTLEEVPKELENENNQSEKDEEKSGESETMETKLKELEDETKKEQDSVTSEELEPEVDLETDGSEEKEIVEEKIETIDDKENDKSVEGSDESKPLGIQLDQEVQEVVEEEETKEDKENNEVVDKVENRYEVTMKEQSIQELEEKEVVDEKSEQIEDETKKDKENKIIHEVEEDILDKKLELVDKDEDVEKSEDNSLIDRVKDDKLDGERDKSEKKDDVEETQESTHSGELEETEEESNGKELTDSVKDEDLLEEIENKESGEMKQLEENEVVDEKSEEIVENEITENLEISLEQEVEKTHEEEITKENPDVERIDVVNGTVQAEIVGNEGLREENPAVEGVETVVDDIVQSELDEEQKEEENELENQREVESSSTEELDNEIEIESKRDEGVEKQVVDEEEEMEVIKEYENDGLVESVDETTVVNETEKDLGSETEVVEEVSLEEHIKKQETDFIEQKVKEQNDGELLLKKEDIVDEDEKMKAEETLDDKSEGNDEYIVQAEIEKFEDGSKAVVEDTVQSEIVENEEPKTEDYTDSDEEEVELEEMVEETKKEEGKIHDEENDDNKKSEEVEIVDENVELKPKETIEDKENKEIVEERVETIEDKENDKSVEGDRIAEVVEVEERVKTRVKKKKEKKPKVKVIRETKEERIERGQKCLKEAFEKYKMVLEKHTEMYPNQLDFHNYCLNRLSMRVYYNFLKLRTLYCTQGYFIKALKGMIRCSLEMNNLGLETDVELEPEVDLEQEKKNKIIIRGARDKKVVKEKKNKNIRYCVQWMKTVLSQRVYDTGLYLLFYKLAVVMKMDVLFKLQCITRCYYSSRCNRMNHHLIEMVFDFLVKIEKYGEFDKEMVKKMVDLCVDEDLLEEIEYEELLENADKELAFKYLNHMMNRVVSEKYEFKQVNALVVSGHSNESSEFFEKLFLDSELLYNEITFKDYVKYRRCFIKAISTCTNEENKEFLKVQMNLLKHLCSEEYVVDSF